MMNHRYPPDADSTDVFEITSEQTQDVMAEFDANGFDDAIFMATEYGLSRSKAEDILEWLGRSSPDNRNHVQKDGTTMPRFFKPSRPKTTLVHSWKWTRSNGLRVRYKDMPGYHKSWWTLRELLRGTQNHGDGLPCIETEDSTTVTLHV